MQRAAQLVLIFLVSGLVTLGIIGANIGSLPLRLPQASRPQPDKAKIDPGARYATARILAASGRLREAQDEYLRILQTTPADPGAMRELIGIRRRLAADDPTLLRRQATAYRQAIARRVETPEHYSRDSMELLASASLQAAAAIESGRSSLRNGAAARQSLGFHATPRPTTPAPTQPAASAAAPVAPPATSAQPSPASTDATSAAPQSPSAEPRAPAPNAGIPVTPQPSSPLPPAATPSPGADKPASGQPSSEPTETQETVAVLTPPREPSVSSSQGSLVKIDCQKHTFVLHDANGDEEYQTTPNVAIYIRGAQSQRLPEFCGLQSFLGHAVTAWTISGGDGRVAKEVSVAL